MKKNFIDWKTKSKIKNTYSIEGDDLIYDRKLSEVYSNKKTKLEDYQKNIFYTEEFKFNFISSILKAKKLSLFDNKKNQYYLDFALINLQENKFLGSNISIDFEDSLFGNNENDQKLKGNSLVYEKIIPQYTKVVLLLQSKRW